MSCKCKNKKYCKCSSNEGADTSATLASLQEQLSEIENSVRFLTCGHPTIMLEDADDIAAFDMNTGLGSDCWEGWGICNGSSYTSPIDGSVVQTLNLIDRFPVGAGGNYNVGDSGGADSVALTVAEMPTHNHGVTDAGHTHAINDAGHTHGVDDVPHSHTGSSTPHTHTFTTDNDGLHQHTDQDNYQDDRNDIAQDFVTGISVASTSELQRTVNSDGSAHSHSGTTDAASVSVTTNPSPTGISIQSAFTGITNVSNTTGITVNNNGNGDDHENRPPYMAVLFVKKIYTPAA
jgi:microcystin-dependent protein